MFRQNLKFANLYAMAKMAHNKSAVKPCRYSTETSTRTKVTAAVPQGTTVAAPVNRRDSSKQVSLGFAMQEFFFHPLTWDRNNGFFNILLGLAIFGYCFCVSCHSDSKTVDTQKAQEVSKKK